MSSILLSHNHQDKPFVRRLASDLRSRGARVWVDEAEMQVGDSLIERIEAALDEVDYVGVVLSKNSVKSDWVRKEVEIALSRELRDKKVVILPLLLEDCTIPAFLRGKLYADFSRPDGYASAVELLARRLGLSALQIISLTEATALITEFGKDRSILHGPVRPGQESPLGTHCYKSRTNDTMGVIYVHASGPRVGLVFYVRKGIAILYEDLLGGSACPLGLPISNEELVDKTGFPTSFFESGYIDWSPKTWIGRAVHRVGDTVRVLAEERV